MPRVNLLGQPIGEALDGWQAPPRPTRTAIEGRWARLEPLSPDTHGRALFEANALDRDGRNWTYLPVGPFSAFADYDAWLRTMAAGDDPLFYTIVDCAQQRPIGVAAYLRIDPAAGSIEVGHINFSPLAQRSRMATDVIYQMMRHAFELGYRRYEWKCNAHNLPSRRAAERLGFVYEGLFRQHMIIKGRNRDTAWFGMTDRDWAVLRPAYQRWLDPANFDDAGTQRLVLRECIADASDRRGRPNPILPG